MNRSVVGGRGRKEGMQADWKVGVGKDRCGGNGGMGRRREMRR